MSNSLYFTAPPRSGYALSPSGGSRSGTGGANCRLHIPLLLGRRQLGVQTERRFRELARPSLRVIEVFVLLVLVAFACSRHSFAPFSAELLGEVLHESPVHVVLRLGM